MVHHREQSLAQNAITMMGQHSVIPIPENYELFYFYVAGSNSAIIRRIDEAIAAGEPFTPQMLHRLRENTLGAERTAKALEMCSTNLGLTIDHVMGRISDAGKDAGEFGKTLSHASGGLAAAPSPAVLHELIEGLIGATRTMEARTKDLESELQHSARQITDLRAQLATVRKESGTDALTGIANRKTFDRELDNALKDLREGAEPMALLMCDIDFFKKFNDNWGHQTGDQVLRLVAASISENIKGRDTAARYGGEEFAIILRQTKIDDAINLANQIRASIEKRKLVKKSTGDVLGSITVSIGVTDAFMQDSTEELVQRADKCLYRAKQTGRNRVIGQHGRD